MFSVLIALLLSSCIDGLEEIRIHSDGSGRAEFTYDIPAAAAALQGGRNGVEKLIDSLLADFPEATHRVILENDRLNIHASIPFNSVEDLTPLSDSSGGKPLPPAFRHFAGTLQLEQHGRTIDFSRTIEPGKAIPGSRFIPPSQLENRRLVHIIHLPIPATGSNATRTKNSGRTLIWETPLATALRQPVTTRFRAVIPFPSWLLPSACGALALFGIWGLAKIVKKNRRLVSQAAE